MQDALGAILTKGMTNAGCSRSNSDKENNWYKTLEEQFLWRKFSHKEI